MPETWSRFEELAYWDGSLSGILQTMDGQVWYYDMRGDDVGSDEPRVYNAWKLPEWPDDSSPIYARDYEPEGNPDASFTESFIRSYKRRHDA